MWISIFIVLFILGSIMGLKPSSRERFLDNLRMMARRLELNPKLIATPNWLIGNSGEKGHGMIAQYGLIMNDIKLPACDFQIIDGQWRPYTGNHPANFALDKVPVELPDTIESTVQGMSAKANFICIYWKENSSMGNPANLENSEKDLTLLKTQLQHFAQLLQNG